MDSSGSTMVQDSSKLSPGASARKMKQSRLPFQILSTSAKTFDEPVEARKRKPSTEGIDLGHVAKAGRISEVKENVTTLVAEETRKQIVEIAEPNVTNADMETSEPAVGCSGLPTSKANKKSSGKSDVKRTESPKILIKLPIGKRKRPLGKVKPVKRKAFIEDRLNLSGGITNEVLILDDTDLSDDSIDETENRKSLSVKEDSKILHDNSKNVTMTPNSTIVLESSAKDYKFVADSVGVSDTKTNYIGSPQLDAIDKKEQDMEALFKEDIFAPHTEVELKTHSKTDRSSSANFVDPASDIDSSEDDVYMLCTPNSKIVPNEDDNRARKLTPKQIARRQEYEKRQAIKQKEKEEKLRKLQQEKDEKAREKEEQERLRRKEREEKEEQKRKEREEKEELRRRDREEREEQKRKEREEKEEHKRKEREEKERKRLVEIEQKNEERRLKEEERRKKEEQKEEERKRKEEEKEAEEKRKQKVAQAFTSFFVKKPINGGGVKASDDENSVESCFGGITSTTTTIMERQRFMPFCIKGDMRLAPTVRRVLDDVQRDALERVFYITDDGQAMDRTNLYLEKLKSKSHKPLKTDRTWNVEDEEECDDIMVVDENVCHQIEEDPGKMKQKLKTKFFLFEENRRPPYRGTWRKRSCLIKARRPFAQDMKFFDYEVDSDDEWEEEEPGESLHGSDDEKDVDPEEDYEVDNEFFVPHGHLSDEELHAEEEGEIDDNSPEVQKVKLKLMQQEFVAEMKKKTEKIKPRLIGCIWTNVSAEDKARSSECSAIIWKMLDDRAMLYNPDEPISFTRSHSRANGSCNDQDLTSISPSKDIEKSVIKKVKITDEAVCDLARLVHGNVNNRKFLVREFHAFWNSRNESVEFSFESIRNKIKEIAKWGACRIKGTMEGKLCWTVENSVLEQCKLMDLPLPNDWKYQLQKESFIKMDKKPDAKQESKLETQKTPPIDTNNARKDANEVTVSTSKTKLNETTSMAGSIVKFAKVMFKEDENETLVLDSSTLKKGLSSSLLKNLDSKKEKNTTKPATKCSSTETFTDQNSKKRVKLLMSVPRGQNINQSTKNNLISQFLCRENRKNDQSIKKSDDTIIEID
uniref:Uncharacterized protein n=1 Tax=Anopheles gambiae TaxID=7165 RepID=A0A1S4GBK2_ANOGA